jgi:hypothetical protein
VPAVAVRRDARLVGHSESSQAMETGPSRLPSALLVRDEQRRQPAATRKRCGGRDRAGVSSGNTGSRYRRMET